MLRLGIVGMGIIANDYLTLISEGRVDNMEVTALCSRELTRAEETAKRYGLRAKAFSDYEEMLSSGCVDAVLICTPHTQHMSMAQLAFERGIHVLVEKPVGIFGGEVENNLAIQRAHPELVCGVMYNRRASKAYRYVHELVHSGELGDLVRCSWLMTNLYRPNSYYGTSPWRGTWKGEGGGLLMTQASHQLDLMQWICGMPESVLGRISTVNRPIKVENEAELFLAYPGGAHGHFIASAHECPGTNRLEICGTKGRVTVTDDSVVEVIRLEEDEREFAVKCPLPFEKVPGTSESLFFDDSDNKLQHAATIQNFVNAVEAGEKIQCSLEEGYGSLQIIHGAYLSHWLGRSVDLPCDEKEFRRLLEEQK